MRKLEELFDLPQQEAFKDTETVDVSEPDNIPVLSDALTELEKITAALPQVRGLEASDREMDDLADKATKSFDDLMDLGMNIDSRWASDVFSVASNMLGHAITAKNAKLQKKLKMIELQLKKARLDQTSKAEDETAQTGTGVLLDRNELLQRLLNREDKKS
jgi:phage gp29-like protein